MTLIRRGSSVRTKQEQDRNVNHFNGKWFNGIKIDLMAPTLNPMMLRHLVSRKGNGVVVVVLPDCDK